MSRRLLVLAAWSVLALAVMSLVHLARSERQAVGDPASSHPSTEAAARSENSGNEVARAHEPRPGDPPATESRAHAFHNGVELEIERPVTGSPSSAGSAKLATEGASAVQGTSADVTQGSERPNVVLAANGAIVASASGATHGPKRASDSSVSTAASDANGANVTNAASGASSSTPANGSSGATATHPNSEANSSASVATGSAPRAVDATSSGTPQSPPTSPPAPAKAPATAPKSGDSTQDPAKPGSKPDDVEYVPGLGPLPKGPPPEYEGLGIQILSNADGQLVLGAIVRSAVQSEIQAWKAIGRDAEREDPEDILGLGKGALPAGAPGFALSPSEPGMMLVDARQGSRYGYAWVNRSQDSRVVMRLCEDVTLHLRTFDASGAVVPNAPLCVRDAQRNIVWRGRSDGEGNQAIRHAAFRFETQSEAGDFFLGVDAVSPSSSEQRLRRGSYPTGTLHVTVAPGGTLTARILDPEQKTVALGLPVVLSAFDAENRLVGSQTSTAGADGKVVFERVDRGSKLLVRAIGGDAFEDVEKRLDAPFASSENASVEIAFTKRVPVLAGVLVDTKKKPLADQYVRLWITRTVAGVMTSTEETIGRTDAAGVFRWPLRDWRGAVKLTLQAGEKADFFWYSAETELPAPPATGVHDAGSVVLDRPKGLAVGKVFDEEKKPVKNVEVTLAAIVKSSDGTERVEPDWRWSVRTDDLGRFRVRGFAQEGKYALVVRSNDHLPLAPTPIEIGETPREVVITKAGSIAGQILLPDRMTPSSVSLELTPKEGRPVEVPLWSDGSFVARPLAAGEWTARLSVRGVSIPFSTIEGIQIRGGARTNDARLSPFEGKRAVRVIHVRARDSAGAPPTKGSIQYTFLAENREASVTLELVAGECDVAFTTSHVQFEIRSEGFRTQKIGPVDDDQTITLERGN